MPKKLDLTENLEKYIIDHSESLTDVQKEIIQYNISLGDQQRLQISVSQAQFLQTLIKNKDKVDQYKSGKEKLFGFFVGQVMKQSGGKANPQLTNDILKKLLKG